MAGKSEQETIKEAVSGENDKSDESGSEEVFVPSPGSGRMFGGSNIRETGIANGGMQPSIMESGESVVRNPQTQEQGQEEHQEYAGMPADYNQQSYDYGQAQQGEYVNQGQQTQDYTQQYPQDQSQQGNWGMGQYQPYQDMMSSDVITEISEQVVDDKLSVLREKMEKAINFGNTAETRIASVDKRLKRIEQIIDTLQISLLQRVSEYVTDIKDIKNEIEETHKTMKAGHHLHGEHQHEVHHTEHHAGHPHTTHHASHSGHHVGHSTHHSHVGYKGKKRTP